MLLEFNQGKAEFTPPHDESPMGLKNKILKSIEDLPLIPSVVIEIQNQLSRMDVNTKKVAALIETDPGITSKVLRIANSAYYGASGKISTILQASVVLGLRGLSEVVILAGAAKTLSGTLPGYGYDAGDLWKHSLAVAYGSKILAYSRDPGICSEAHTAGLIHDIAKIILDPYVRTQKKRFEDYMQKTQKTFLDAETEIFGFTHAELAAAVCKTWNFPDYISNAINWHHNPEESNADLLSHILHVADNLAFMGGAGYDDDDILNQIQKESLSLLQLKENELSDILFKVIDSMSKTGIF
jgi:HD-like signal output (HDOD) protein